MRREAFMRIRGASLAAWAVALLGGGLYALQAASASCGGLTLRYAASGLLTAAAGLAVARWRRDAHAARAPAPDAATLALAGVTALCLWAAAWWLMDWTDHMLNHQAGQLALPTPITALEDRLLGLDLGQLSYELGILWAVVLLPLAQGWLLWGLLQPEITARTGTRRAVVIAGAAGGALMALSAVQNVAPAMPWGLASWPGYTLIALVAALLVALTRSPWPGVTACAVYAYASFAWRADLLREFGGLDYWHPKWLTVVVAGALGAGVCLQVIRFRADGRSAPHPPAPSPTLRGGKGSHSATLPPSPLVGEGPGMGGIDTQTSRAAQPPGKGRTARAGNWLPLALLALAVLVMAVRDVDARRTDAPPVALQTAQE